MQLLVDFVHEIRRLQGWILRRPVRLLLVAAEQSGANLLIRQRHVGGSVDEEEGGIPSRHRVWLFESVEQFWYLFSITGVYLHAKRKIKQYGVMGIKSLQ